MQQSNKILLSGASGFIGSALLPFLNQAGWEIFRLVRHRPASDREIQWNPGSELSAAALPRDLGAVINLSGSPIAVPFTASNRQRILTSRLDSTSTLVAACLQLPEPPMLFISASGIGYYGDRGQEELREDSRPGTDFVADVCVQWEAMLSPLHGTTCRTVSLRTGIVLDPAGGALAKMLPAFRTGAGATLGSGQQYMSWISLRDYLRIVLFSLENASVKGSLNVVSPQPVSNAEFSRALASALNRPLLLRAPAWSLQAVMGDMARLLLLASQRVIPAALEKAGFNWEDPDLQTLLDGFFKREV